MAFKLIPAEKTIPWPITVRDRDGNGQTADIPVTIHYRFQADYRKTTVGESVVGWEGVLDADGHPLPCTPENKELAFGHLALSAAISEGFFQLVRGEHLRKN